MGWDVYPEVAINRGGARADLVARRDNLIWAIETKMGLNAAVCWQARQWIGWAHFVSVVTPYLHRGGGNVYRYFLIGHGIGWYTVRRHDFYRNIGLQIDIEAAVDGRMILRRQDLAHMRYMRDALHPDMKRYKPGTSGSFSSPWRRTMNEAVAFIKKNPGATLKSIVSGIAHHYHNDVSARSALRHWLDRDERVNSSLIGRALCYEMKGEGNATQEGKLEEGDPSEHS